MADDAKQMKKELDLLKLELSTMKNSIELLQSDPVLNNLPGGSLTTPNLSTREHSPYWGPFRCEISEDGGSVNIGAGLVFFGSDGALPHEFTGASITVATFISQYVWVGLQCIITETGIPSYTVNPITSVAPTQVPGQYDAWLAKVFVGGDGKATWLEQRWQGSDLFVPVWIFCGESNGQQFDCVDGRKPTIGGAYTSNTSECRRVAQLGSPACNPGMHNHNFHVYRYDAPVWGETDQWTDCWCEGVLDVGDDT